MLFCCLWCNVETSCHKHFTVLSRHQQTPPLTTSEVSPLLTGRWSDRVVLTTPGHVAALTARIEAIYWLRIAISAYPTHMHSTSSLGGSRRNCYTVWYWKTRMVWLTGSEKNYYVYCFDRMYERDRHTDRQTDWHRMTTQAALAWHRAAKIHRTNFNLLGTVTAHCVITTRCKRSKVRVTWGQW